MAAVAPQPMKFEGNGLLIKQALEDFGVPAQKILEIYNVYDSCFDYMKDVEKFKENYDKFQKIQTMADTVKQNAKDVADQVNALNDDILQKDSWLNWFGVSSINDDKMNAAESTVDEIKQNTEDLEKIFESPAKVTAEADEILNRRNVLRVIQLVLVFKDVVFGIQKVINTSRDIKYYNEQFTNIYDKYVAPTIQSFANNGSVDNDLIERGIFMLKNLKHNVEKKQYETQQSIITHGINAISTGLQAYATFKNINLLSDIASKSALTINYFIGASQVGLAVGSAVLTGIETYNYLEYKALIDKIEDMIHTLEDYERYKSKSN